MHRTLVAFLMLETVALVVRLWPPGREPPPPTLIGISGATIDLDEDACAGPALRELTKHPNWSFTFDERETTDYSTPDPDEVLQTVVLDSRAGTWRDGHLPQSLELDPAERTDLLAAAQRSCRQFGDLGYTLHYVTLTYGTEHVRRDQPLPHYSIELAPRSRAVIDAIAVMDRVRARYITARVGRAKTMTLTLRGARRNAANAWEPYAVTFRPDGRIIDPRGHDLDLGLQARDRVDLLDWAMQLPATARGPRRLTGTLEVAGKRRTVALQLDAVARWFSADGWRGVLGSWSLDSAEPAADRATPGPAR